MSNQYLRTFIQNEAETSIFSENGLGIGVSEYISSLTPYSSFKQQNSSNQTYRIGNKFKFGQGITLNIENSFKIYEYKNNENKIKISGRIQW